jgi:hypothetical protein
MVGVCYGDAIFKLIEDYPCANKTELERREGIIMKEYMNNDEMDDVVNHCIAGRTYMEWREDNISDVKRKQKIYEEANKTHNVQIRKKYYINNRSKINQQKRIRRDEHKEEINLKRKVKITCELCGQLIHKECIRRHQLTEKCQAIQERINNKAEFSRKAKIKHETNKEELKIRRAVKINCHFCGQLGNKDHIRKHQRSKKCQAIQEQKSKNGFSVA